MCVCKEWQQEEQQPQPSPNGETASELVYSWDEAALCNSVRVCGPVCEVWTLRVRRFWESENILAGFHIPTHLQSLVFRLHEVCTSQCTEWCSLGHFSLPSSKASFALRGYITWHLIFYNQKPKANLSLLQQCYPHSPRFGLYQRKQKQFRPTWACCILPGIALETAQWLIAQHILNWFSWAKIWLFVGLTCFFRHRVLAGVWSSTLDWSLFLQKDLWFHSSALHAKHKVEMEERKNNYKLVRQNK